MDEETGFLTGQTCPMPAKQGVVARADQILQSLSRQTLDQQVNVRMISVCERERERKCPHFKACKLQTHKIDFLRHLDLRDSPSPNIVTVG